MSGLPGRTRKIVAPKLPHIVARQLRYQITNGELVPGDRLPMEPALLKQLGISRPTLREALRILESEGLVELGRGARNGARILAPSIEMAAQFSTVYLATQNATLGQLHDVRTILEPGMAARHATRRTPKCIAALEQCLARQTAALAVSDFVAAAAAVNDYHGELIRHTGNPALRLLAGMLQETTDRLYRQLPEAGGRVSRETFWRRSAKSTEAHAALLKLIKARKARQAEDFWRNYMRSTGAWLKRAGLSELKVQLAGHGR